MPDRTRQAGQSLRTTELHGVVRSIVGASTEESEADPTGCSQLYSLMLVSSSGARHSSAWVTIITTRAYFAPLSVNLHVGGKERAKPRCDGSANVEDKRCGPLAWKPGPMSSGEGLIHAIRDGDGKAGDAGVADKGY